MIDLNDAKDVADACAELSTRKGDVKESAAEVILALIAEVRTLREDAERWRTYIRLFSADAGPETAAVLTLAIDDDRAKGKA